MEVLVGSHTEIGKSLKKFNPHDVVKETEISTTFISLDQLSTLPNFQHDSVIAKVLDVKDRVETKP